MALNASTVWECRTTGNDTNGGGYDPSVAGGADLSQADVPAYAVVDAVANGTTTVTSASANFQTNVVGNIAYIAGAWYLVTARTSATAIVTDRVVATASGATLRIGGALLSPAIAALQGIGDIAIRGPGTFPMSATANVAAGKITFNSPAGCIFGYSATRSRMNTDPVANRPVLQPSAAGVTCILANAANQFFANLSFQNPSSFGSSVAIDGTTVNTGGVFRCAVVQYVTGIKLASFWHVDDVSIGGCSDPNGVIQMVQACVIKDTCTFNSFSGIVGSNTQNECVRCNVALSASAAAGTACFQSVAYLRQCNAYGAIGTAFANCGLLINCIWDTAGAYGYTAAETGVMTAHTAINGLVNCAGNAAASGNYLASAHFDATRVIGFQALSGTPFVAPARDATGNFQLNTGIGATLIAAGFPAALPGLTPTQSLDIGAYQASAAATGGGGGGGAGAGGGAGPTLGMRIY